MASPASITAHQRNPRVSRSKQNLYLLEKDICRKLQPLHCSPSSAPNMIQRMVCNSLTVLRYCIWHAQILEPAIALKLRRFFLTRLIEDFLQLQRAPHKNTCTQTSANAAPIPPNAFRQTFGGMGAALADVCVHVFLCGAR